MSQDCQVELRSVSKRYNIYDRPIDRLKELVMRNKRSYHREFWSLKNFSYKFQKHTTAVLGPNGSGKSTMLQIVAGILQPTAGSVIADGRMTAILELGAGFQPEATGRENVILNGLILGISLEEITERVDEIAEFAEIGDFIDQPIKTYSSGMAVRLAFAAATSVDPDILLIDEALAVGDGRFERKCAKRINDLQKTARTIIFVSHNMAVVKDWCQEAVLLNGGEIVASGDVQEVIKEYNHLMETYDPTNHRRFYAPHPTVPV